MADKKTFGNKDMVGTPRGYVKKKDIERVDREMTPILKGATTALTFMPVVGPMARAGVIAYRGAKAAKAVTKAKDAVKAGRRFAPAGAKEAPKAAPKKKSDGVNATLAGLGGATAIGYGASKMFPARKGETAGSYPARKQGGGPQSRQGSSSASMPKKFSVASTKDVEKAYQSVNRKHGTDRPVGEVFRQAPIPKAKPAMDKSRLAGKSKTRIAFEKEFAKQRKAGKKEFTFRGKKYTTKLK